MRSIFIIFISTLLFSNNYPSFSELELEKIEKKSGKISKNRVLDYIKNINIFHTYPPIEKLNAINFYLNRLLSQHDNVIRNKEDHWATPKEFLILGYGDCEDYAIIKYYSLIKLGFDKNKLFFTVVTEKYFNSKHMVLSYFIEENKPPLILDNLSFKILDLEQRKDLSAELFINDLGLYILRSNKLVKQPLSSLKYNNLNERIKSEL